MNELGVNLEGGGTDEKRNENQQPNSFYPKFLEPIQKSRNGIIRRF